MNDQSELNLPVATDEAGALTAIRTETALSRFPIHRLSKKGEVQIDLQNQGGAIRWEVTYNSKYGQPGPMAYKLDTLIVNRRIEDAGHPVPELIRLGSLRDICRELGGSEGGAAVQAVRRALLQNASAFINAQIRYRTNDRRERFLEASFTRYAVIFTGESLPDGRSADAVYLSLTRPYMEVLHGAPARPLDYEYMRALPPAAQRFYEIVSYQVYAALRFGNAVARLRYSEYCLLSTATRYGDFDHVKKQMYKIHKPHLDSGYLGKVTFEETADAAGNPDWWMCYAPGPAAVREFHAFAAPPGSVPVRPPIPGAQEAPRPPIIGEQEEAPQALIMGEGSVAEATTDETDPLAELTAALTAAGLNRRAAERLAARDPDECRRQLAYLPYVTEFKSSRGAYLRRAIEDGYAPPKAYTPPTDDAPARAAAADRPSPGRPDPTPPSAARLEAYAAFLGTLLGRLDTAAPDVARAFADWERRDRAFWSSGPLSARAESRRRIAEYDQPDPRRQRFQRFLDDAQQTGRPHPGVPTFDEWAAAAPETPAAAPAVPESRPETLDLGLE